jgi:hypothetical protein
LEKYSPSKKGDKTVNVTPGLLTDSIKKQGTKKAVEDEENYSPGDDLALIKKQVVAKGLKEEVTPQRPLIGVA